MERKQFVACSGGVGDNTGEGATTITTLLQHLPASSLPSHLAVVMDGNARWARRRGRTRAAGHAAGVDALRLLVANCLAIPSLDCLTVYAFSWENFGRPQDEVGQLLRLIEATLEREADALHERGVRLGFIGELDQLPASLRGLISRLATRAPPEPERLLLVLALAYGSRREIAAVSASLAAAVARGELDEAEIDEHRLAKALGERGAGLSHVSSPDLLLRTGGQRRLSNFMLFQVAYTELAFVDHLWPEFGTADLASVLADFVSRNRTFGLRAPR